MAPVFTALNHITGRLVRLVRFAGFAVFILNVSVTAVRKTPGYEQLLRAVSNLLLGI